MYGLWKLTLSVSCFIVLPITLTADSPWLVVKKFYSASKSKSLKWWQRFKEFFVIFILECTAIRKTPNFCNIMIISLSQTLLITSCTNAVSCFKSSDIKAIDFSGTKWYVLIIDNGWLNVVLAVIPMKWLWSCKTYW